MLNKKPKTLESGNVIGKMVVLGCLAGAIVSGMSSKRTNYKSYFATKMAVLGSVLYAGGKAVRFVRERIAKKDK